MGCMLPHSTGIGHLIIALQEYAFKMITVMTNMMTASEMQALRPIRVDNSIARRRIQRLESRLAFHIMFVQASHPLCNYLHLISFHWHSIDLQETSFSWDHFVWTNTYVVSNCACNWLDRWALEKLKDLLAFQGIRYHLDLIPGVKCWV